MKNFITLSLLACVGIMMSSCSRSLTDIGYPGADIGTRLPTKEGFLDRSGVNNNAAFNPDANSYNDNMGFDNYVIESMYPEALPKEIIRSLQKLYKKLLACSFRYDRFSSKYNCYLEESLRQNLGNRLANSKDGNQYGVWQYLLCGGSAKDYVVTHVGENSYKVYPKGDEKHAILLKVYMQTRTTKKYKPRGMLPDQEMVFHPWTHPCIFDIVKL